MESIFDPSRHYLTGRSVLNLIGLSWFATVYGLSWAPREWFATYNEGARRENPSSKIKSDIWNSLQKSWNLKLQIFRNGIVQHSSIPEASSKPRRSSSSQDCLCQCWEVQQTGFLVNLWAGIHNGLVKEVGIRAFRRTVVEETRVLQNYFRKVKALAKSRARGDCLLMPNTLIGVKTCWK